MYQINRDTVRMVRSFSVPPAFDPAIAGKPLSDLTLAFAEAWDGEAMRCYVEALSEASVEEIERARPQIYFTANNVAQRLSDKSFVFTRSLKDLSSPGGVVGEILNGVTGDAERLLGECDRAPRNKRKLRELAGALHYLAEIEVFSAAIANSCDPSFQSLAAAAKGSFDRIGRLVEAFRDKSSVRYPEVAAVISGLDQIRAAAEETLRAVDFSLPRLSAAAIRRMLSAIGDHQDLWAVAAGRNREQLIASGRHQPVDARSAEEISTGVRRLMEDFDSVFNRQGFLAELRKCAVAFRYLSLERVDWAHRYDEGYVRRQRRSIYASDKEHEAEIADAIARLPAEKQRNLDGAATYQSTANMLSGFLHRAGRALRGDAAIGFVHFRRENGAMVGELDVAGSDAIVIYDDHIVRRNGQHQDAVYAVRMPAEVVARGVPPLEEVRESHSGQATNYHSLVQCLTELDNDTEHKFFFGGIRISGHDGFDVLDGAVSLKESVEPAAGMRP